MPAEQRTEVSTKLVTIHQAGGRADEFCLYHGTHANQTGADGVNPSRLDVLSAP
jgi:hypothetical protein